MTFNIYNLDKYEIFLDDDHNPINCGVFTNNIDSIVNELKLAGFDYEWFDPLVESWEGKKCKDINGDYSAAILVVNQPGIDLSTLIKNKVPVLDCTYTFTNLMGVISL